MAVGGVLRQRVLSRWLGDGLTGALGASLIGWGIGKLGEGLRKDPEVLDVSKLIPGETYTVVTRPAPRRRERKLERRATRATAEADRRSRPTRAQRRTDKAAARARRRAGRADPTTRSGQRRLATAADLEAKSAKLAVPSAKQRAAVAARDRAQAALAAERERAQQRSRRDARPPRRVTFR